MPYHLVVILEGRCRFAKLPSVDEDTKKQTLVFALLVPHDPAMPLQVSVQDQRIKYPRVQNGPSEATQTSANRSVDKEDGAYLMQQNVIRP